MCLVIMRKKNKQAIERQIMEQEETIGKQVRKLASYKQEVILLSTQLTRYRNQIEEIEEKHKRII